jgi:signal transduction histidine kinase
MGRSEFAPRLSAAGTPYDDTLTHDPRGDSVLGDDHAESRSMLHQELEAPLRIDLRHDLRHEASTILLLLATLRDATDDASIAFAHDGIAQCAQAIASMIADADARDPLELVQLDEVAQFAVRRASLLYNGSVVCDATPATVSASTTDIARLLANLIENSCRAAGPRGTVEVRVRARGKSCELQVGDSGTGFVEDLGPRGIGLSSIAGIAVRLGGVVTFGQSSLGGALVTVTLPRVTREEESALRPGGAHT